jgi:hypothetical protein
VLGAAVLQALQALEPPRALQAASFRAAALAKIARLPLNLPSRE